MELVKADDVTVPFEGMTTLPVVRQVGLLVGLAASIALGIAIVLWMSTPNYTALPGQISGQTLNDVLAVLDKNDIGYVVDANTKSVMVESTKVNEAKLKLATENLSLNTGHGFEMVEKDEGFGTSSFLQKARYQRALEGELARTITSMRAVKSARVHLALPKESAFIRNKREASASVFIGLIAGHTLDKNQISAITNLVASSIQNLKASEVTIVDEQGGLLSSSKSFEMLGLTTSQLDYSRNIEENFVRRIERMLNPIVGVGNVRAQVTADIDFTRTESTEETFNPDLPAVRSEQNTEEESKGAGQGGIPGALTNQPPANADAPEQANAGQGGGANQASSKTSKRNTRNYELDKTISHIRHRTGGIKRLSIAVVLNDKRVVTIAQPVVDEEAEEPVEGEEVAAPVEVITNVPYTALEIARITELVRKTVGFSILRGDSVNIVNIPFTQTDIEELPELPFYEHAWFWDIAKQMLGVLGVLFVVFGVLRPAMKNLSIIPSKLKEIEAEEAATLAAELEEDQLSLTTEEEQEMIALEESYADNLIKAQQLALDEPKLVAQVIRSWMAR